MAAAQTTEMMVEYERDNTIAAAADGSLHHVSTDGSESVSVSQALVSTTPLVQFIDSITLFESVALCKLKEYSNKYNYNSMFAFILEPAKS